jgi:hypothetical protein
MYIPDPLNLPPDSEVLSRRAADRHAVVAALAERPNSQPARIRRGSPFASLRRALVVDVRLRKRRLS